MSNDVKDRGLTGAILDALWPILGGSHTAASVWTEIDNAVSDVIARHQPQEREAVLEGAAQRIFENYEFGVWTPGEKPAWVPNGNSEMQHVARAFARAALTTPAPAVTEDDQALFDDICAKMTEVLKPLPGELSEGDEA